MFVGLPQTPFFVSVAPTHVYGILHWRLKLHTSPAFKVPVAIRFSDAMLPLDTVTSQPPPMPAGAAEGDAEESPGETATGPAADATPTPEASAPATAAPKPSPTPKPSASADE